MSAHRGGLVQQELARCNGRLWAARLPAYAPELNPAESLWAWLKQQRLANVAESGIDRLARRVTDGTRNYRRRPLLLGAFLAKEAGLFL